MVQTPGGRDAAAQHDRTIWRATRCIDRSADCSGRCERHPHTGDARRRATAATAESSVSTGLTFAAPADVEKIPLAGFPLMGTLRRRLICRATFPAPGDQGKQGSCVGWAVAHALEVASGDDGADDIGSWKWGARYHLQPGMGLQPRQGLQLRRRRALIPAALDFVKENGAATVALFPMTLSVCSRRVHRGREGEGSPVPDCVLRAGSRGRQGRDPESAGERQARVDQA